MATGPLPAAKAATVAASASGVRTTSGTPSRGSSSGSGCSSTGSTASGVGCRPSSITWPTVRGNAAGAALARGGQSMMRARMDTATISARSPVPSLRAIRARWLLTVSADRCSVVPISRLDCPSATSRSTSISRADSE